MWINSDARGASMNGTQDPRPHPKSAPPVKAESGRKRKRLTQEKVRELFDYHEDGYLVRRVTVASNARAGDRAGSVKQHGYTTVDIEEERYLYHRVIWLWHYGYLPEHSVDHIDRNSKNNKIHNLREVTHQCNIRNSKLKKHNVSGVCGVYLIKGSGRWRADIRVNGKIVYFGTHADFTEAVAHRLAAEQCCDWEGCNSTSSAYLFLKKRGFIK